MTNVSTVNLIDNGISIDINGTTVGTIDIPSDYVPRTFAPVLGTHLLVTGDKLKEGMIVLLEDSLHRRDLPENGRELSSYEQESLDESSRWAVVTDLRTSANGPDSRIVKFTAIYADGTMRDRTYNVSFKWSVLREFRAVPACPNCGSVHPEEQPLGFPGGLFGGLLGAIAKEFLEEILGESDEAEESVHDDVNDDLPRDGETAFEFVERMRDKAEARGEYSQDERPKLSTDGALAALRDKLMGASAPTETGLNGYPVVDPEEEAAALRERRYADEMTGRARYTGF